MADLTDFIYSCEDFFCTRCLRFPLTRIPFMVIPVCSTGNFLGRPLLSFLWSNCFTASSSKLRKYVGCWYNLFKPAARASSSSVGCCPFLYLPLSKATVEFDSLRTLLSCLKLGCEELIYSFVEGSRIS